MRQDYYQKSMRALQLAGMSERTQQCYTRSVRMLVDFYSKTPDKLTELELQNYFLHRKNVDKWSAATLRICYSGIKFYFVNVLKRDWHTLELIHAKREQRLPVVLSVREVWTILNAVRTPQCKAYLTAAYTCGLRLHEGLHLQVADIDSDRMRIHVHRGKGAKDRYVPLPGNTLAILQCDRCKKHHTVFRSCGNRHCPNCRHHKQHRWLNRRIEHQLPGHHFMVTFTVPESLRGFIYRHQRVAYDALFKASADTIKKLTANGRHIDGDMPGFFGALHTWGGQLQYHPHIHYVVTGGAYCSSKDCWTRSRIDFLLPVLAMSKVFRAKFKNLMIYNDLYDQIPEQVWQQGFNVDCRAVSSGQRSLVYLSRYLFKVAISDGRIVKMENNRVYFKYRVKNSARLRTTSLGVMTFIGRVLKHVLPKGFVKVRYFGLYNANCSQPRAKIAFLIESAFGFDLPNDKPELKPLPSFPCPHGNNGTLLFLRQILPYKMMRAGVG